MPLLGCRRSALPSQRRKLRQKAGAGDRPTQEGLLDADTPLWSCSSLKIQENPVPPLQGTGAHPFLAGSVFIPLAFKPRNFYQKQARAKRSHACHDGKLPHQATEV